MIYSAKRYLSLLILILWGVGFTQVKGQTIASPDIYCLSVNANGDVTVVWGLPSNLNSNINTFKSYNIYTSSNRNFGYSVTTVGSPFQNSTVIFGTGANTKPIYFYITTLSTKNSVPVDTLSTIYLSYQKPSPGMAVLTWNPIYPTQLPTEYPFYSVYQEYYKTYIPVLVGTVNANTFNPQTGLFTDTINITLCADTVRFEVELPDSSGCVSFSNVTGKSYYVGNAPLAVGIDTVSVTAGNTIYVSWTKSTQGNVIGYIIYNNGTPIDTVYGINSTSFNVTSLNPSTGSYSITVAPIDSCKSTAGAQSNQQNTLFLHDAPDKCAQTNTLTWNTYVNLDGDVGGYIVYYSVNGGPFKILAKTNPQVTTYEDTGLNKIESRCYYVRVWDSLRHDTTASSNIICYSVGLSKPPQNNYLRTASVILFTSDIFVEGFIDTASGAAAYVFQRSTDTGKFSSIDTLRSPFANDTISYTDLKAKPSTQSYIYRILTLDSCNKSVDTTNIGQTIYLTATAQTNGLNTLNWNDYREWYEPPLDYEIYRSLDGINYAFLHTVKYAGPHKQKTSVPAGEYTYEDSIASVASSKGIFYYYIKGMANDTGLTYPYSFRDSSYSNITEAYQNPIVFIPDAFNPNGVNKIFIPVGVFIGVTGYNFSVLNRWGQLIFQSTDPTIGWDGTEHGGKVMEGIYVYLLTYTSNKGQYFQQTGTVTLLR